MFFFFFLIVAATSAAIGGVIALNRKVDRMGKTLQEELDRLKANQVAIGSALSDAAVQFQSLKDSVNAHAGDSIAADALDAINDGFDAQIGQLKALSGVAATPAATVPAAPPPVDVPAPVADSGGGQ